MGQSEVLQVLMKARKPLSNLELAERIKVNGSSVSESTRRLRASNQISYIVYFSKGSRDSHIPKIKYFMTAKQKKEYK